MAKKAVKPRAEAPVDPREVQRMKIILKILHRTYPESKCSLDFKTPYQLLVATVLSAQCTDERVNKVTPALFKRFPDPRAMAAAKIGEIEKLIQSTGFYKNKAKALKESAQAILEEYGGQVPQTMEELVKLRGVGRKTANVVLGNAYGVPSLVVDTHVTRLMNRMGFTTTRDAEKIEQEMLRVVPREEWTDFAHLMISHGREICTARRAYCEECPVNAYCPKIGVVRT